MDAGQHRLCAQTLQCLAMDAVQAAKSGHPGMPMGMADVATVLWTSQLRYDAADPTWPDRDRFVLSAGHGSMLLYGLLHLAGFDLPLDEIRRFRQWGSRTPGHPEVGHTPGVETTTGPLGQGLGNAVGMAMAERWQRETFGAELCDHRVWVIASDGDLMEGISSEAASLAGHLRLGRLVVLWDDNRISIDGSTDLAFTEDVPARFAAFGWRTMRVDGHDPSAIRDALAAAGATDDRPVLVACRTVIGRGSPSYQGSARTHGEPLGVEEIRKTKAAMGWEPDASFVVPEAAVAAFRAHDGPARRSAWEARLAGHARRDEFLAWQRPDVEALLENVSWPIPPEKEATRKSNVAALKALVARAPWLVGGSADLTGSNGVAIGARAVTGERFEGAGAVHWGVREHAMGAAANGIALHGGLRPYVATFLMFHDYHRPSVRLSALMGQPVVWLYSHDSFHLGEDGPTHQPIESLVALRSIPRLEVWRPADAYEVAAAWRAALRRSHAPTAILLTRQDVPTLGPCDDLPHGARIVAEGSDVVVVATGSEVGAALDARMRLEGRLSIRVVSMPCRERFLASPAEARRALLPDDRPRVAFEAARMSGWEAVVGSDGLLVGIEDFGASAPAGVLARQYGLDGEGLASRLISLVS